MQIQLPDIHAEIDLLQNFMGRVSSQALPRAMRRCGLIAHREAKRNAPRSPTQSLINNTRKTSRRRAPKARGTSRAKPGGLERAIEWRASASNAEIFVATNSEAGRYARRIHDEKGISWHERGPGTMAKGPKADDRFIERAVFENQSEFRTIIQDEFDRVKPKGS